MLAAIGGNSPFLSDLAIREATTLRRLARNGPSVVVAAAMRDIAACPLAAPRPRLAATLRQAKRQIALATALADIGGLWTLEQVTGALSDLAQAALSAAAAHLLRAAHAKGVLHLPHPRTPGLDSGFTVLGMGKLGARELNYSSDIDLVLIYDPERHPYHADGLGAAFTRLSRDLCALMEARDADGYVFRTDLRLRPDPAATPPAIALPAALAYYESMGENWERAAMIKARPVAGDLALGDRFLAEIRPFIWRRHLDFAAVADIRAMKRRMDTHHDTALGTAADPVMRLAGHDVKLGEGGIRGVEFAAQTMQLVWAGAIHACGSRRRWARCSNWRPPGICPGRPCATCPRPMSSCAGSSTGCRWWRTGRPTPCPTRATGCSASRSSWAIRTRLPFAGALLAHMDRVRQEDARLFDHPAQAGALDLTAEGLRTMGFREPERVLAGVLAWREGRLRALRSPRAQGLLEAVLPGLLRALAAQQEPDAAFARADMLLSRLSTGVHLLSLFQRQPVLLERVAAVLGAAPSLADHLAQVPAALEGLLAPGEIDADPAATLDRQLADARALDDALAIVRQMVRGEEFRLSVAQMEGRIDADAAGIARTALADAALGALLPA